MKVRDLLAYAVSNLRASGVENAPRDARALVADVICRSIDRVILCANDLVTCKQFDLLKLHLNRRVAGCPVSRILGKRLFWGRDFKIDDHVLDPRGDTETLVALALEKPAVSVLDLGTGSGAIAVTLAAEWPYAKVVGSDISECALKVAKKNAQTHCVRERCYFILSDWYSDIYGTFDLIVSNPPYISQSQINNLSKEVKNFDPVIALSPGENELSAYDLIASGARQFLRPNGRLIVETGHDQGVAVSRLVKDAGYSEIRIHKDLEQKDRVVSCLRE